VTTDARTPRRRRPIRIAAAVAAVGALLAVAGCTTGDGDRLAQQFRDGTGQGYISGDGAYTVIAAADRGDPVAFEGIVESGERVSSDDYLGDVVVVNFWYAACPPCRVEAPDLEAIWQEFQDQGVHFVGVNIRDGVGTALTFADEFGITYPSILDRDDAAVRLAFAGQVAPNAVPTTLVVDQQGRVAARISGLLTEPSTLRAMIRDTLAEAES
jgi:peroxiredoxin